MDDKNRAIQITTPPKKGHGLIYIGFMAFLLSFCYLYNLEAATSHEVLVKNPFKPSTAATFKKDW